MRERCTLVGALVAASAFLAPAAPAAENLARGAEIAADSEYSGDWGARYAIDDQVPAPGSSDRRLAWAVLGQTHRDGATLTLTWPRPVRVAEVVYYGRTASEMGDCWRAVELLANDGTEPIARSELRMVHGPQRVRLREPISLSSLRLRFVGSYGGDNPGAAEVQVFAEPAALRDLIVAPPYPDEYLRELLAQGDDLRSAAALRDQAEAGAATPEDLARAAGWLSHADPFVQATAEWALATKVGQDNNAGEIVWPGREEPAWYRAWLAVTPARLVEYDWIRHALANGLAWSPEGLREDLDRLIARGRATAPLAAARRKGEVSARMQALESVGRAAEVAGADLPALRGLWLEARRALRPIALARGEIDFDGLVFTTRFASHHKPNGCGVHYSFAYKPGGDVCVLDDLRAPEAVARPVLDGRLGPGHIDGMDLWFDADKAVIAWANQPSWPPRDPAGVPYDLCHRQNNYAFELMKATEPPHLYEVALDGSTIEQLTFDGYWSDVEPAYLPDGGIAFASDRSAHSPSCDGWENDITDLNLYLLKPDRRTIRRLANQKDIDMHPHLLENGLIGYLRWEYAERDFWDIHAFWTVRPDGTQADARFKQHLSHPYSIREVRSIPGSPRLVGIAAGHHCYPVGPLVRISPATAISSAEAIEIVAMGSPPEEGPLPARWVAEGGVRDAEGYYLTPYALSDSCFLTSFSFADRFLRPISTGQDNVLSNGAGIYLVDTLGNKELLHRDRLYCAVCPLPLRPRPRPPILPDATDYRRNSAVCAVPNVYEGMEGVAPGEIRFLRILEALPWPVTRAEGARYLGGASFAWQVAQEQVWNPVRVIGTVPVAPDGSACFHVPTAPNSSVYFQALDENRMEIRRMRTSISFQPGEVRSCQGCHETRPTAEPAPAGLATHREPVLPEPPSWGTVPLGYEWLVQPVLDARCVACHGPAEPAGGLDLSGTKVQWGLDSMCGSYFHIRERGLVVCSNQRMDGSVSGVRQFGSHPSKLIRALSDGTHRGLPLTEEERLRLTTWVDANCPYFDTLYNKRPADGGPPRREAFPWHDPWASPSEIPNVPSGRAIEPRPQ